MNTKARQPTSVDANVGQRLRQRRLMLGLSQTKLADASGVTFQMIQKYENGTCRVGASRLIMLAKALDCPITYFFDDMKNIAMKPLKVSESAMNLDDDLMTRKETIDLLKAYYSLREPQRKHILSMVKGLMTDNKD